MSFGIIACGKEEVKPNQSGSNNQETQNTEINTETEEDSMSETEEDRSNL